jgi:peptide/nickel transport system substrate-binding protein
MLVIANRIDDIKTFDPAESFEFAGADVSRNVYEQAGQLRPARPRRRLSAAARRELGDLEDGMTITFTMAKGHMFFHGPRGDRRRTPSSRCAARCC